MRTFSSDPVLINNKMSVFHIIFLLVFSVLTITICSKSSPLYPLNNWDDANCFFTVGKSILDGKVIYKDIFEQKGPLLYFIYSLACLISYNTFIGAYLIEILSCFLFMFFSAKTILLFCNRKALFLMPAAGAVIFASPAFEQGGSAEELCLPFIAFGLYTGVKAIILNQQIRKRDWLILGITSGAVLWIKFSLLGFYIGFGIYMLYFYIKNKWYKPIGSGLLFLFIGEIIAAAPIFIYFIVNDSLYYLFEVYFYCNLFYYTVNDYGSKFLSLFLNLNGGFDSFIFYFGTGCLFIVLGLVYTYHRSKKLYSFYLITLIFSFLLVYVGGRRYAYYSLILAAFLPMSVVLFYKMIPKVFRFLRHLKRPFVEAFAAIIFVLSIGLMYLCSPNTYMMWYTKEQLPQYQFDKIISQKEGATVLNYEFLDGGFYTVSRINPDYRFFCGLNIPLSKDEQDKYIEEGIPDFIITRDEPLKSDIYIYKGSVTFESKKDVFNTYYLYERKKDEDDTPEKEVSEQSTADIAV